MEVQNQPPDVSQDKNERQHKMYMKAEITEDMSDIPSKMTRIEKIKLVHTSRRPWITEEFMQKVKERDELHSRVKQSPGDLALKKQFSVCRNQTASLRKKLKHAYQMYLENL